MEQLKIRKDLDRGVVEVNTGDGWRGLSPAAAKVMADTFDQQMDQPDPGTQQFITLLRQYADDLAGE